MLAVGWVHVGPICHTPLWPFGPFGPLAIFRIGSWDLVSLGASRIFPENEAAVLIQLLGIVAFDVFVAAASAVERLSETAPITNAAGESE